MQKISLPVALKKCETYTEAAVDQAVAECLSALDLNIPATSKILVKPNFLIANKLACTHPLVICAVCRWLLDNGHKPVVADSPGFGTAKKVADFIGLTPMLAKMGVPLLDMSDPQPLPIKLANGRHEILKIGRVAREADLIFSLSKVKAHRQMRVSLSVKNLFGCVTGVRKALLHFRHGTTHEEFADWIVALYKALPRAVTLCDGIICMSSTGPMHGEPFNLGMIAACPSCSLLDFEILSILGQPVDTVPIARFLQTHYPETATPNYPLEKPESFSGSGFKAPAHIVVPAFSVPRIAQSLIRRWWAAA